MNVEYMIVGKINDSSIVKEVKTKTEALDLAQNMLNRFKSVEIVNKNPANIKYDKK